MSGVEKDIGCPRPGLLDRFSHVWHRFLHCSADRAFLRKWKWSQMVMDEAHALKNANSQRSRRLRKLAASKPWLMHWAAGVSSSGAKQGWRAVNWPKQAWHVSAAHDCIAHMLSCWTHALCKS